MDFKDNTALDILVVEDSFSFATELKMLLMGLGYNCDRISESGLEALDAIREKQPDAIIMDIKLKGDMTGIDVAEQINHLNIPILFITSFEDEAYFQQASNLKTIGFLVKPLSEYTLISALDACLEKIARINDDSDDFNIGKTLMVKKNKTYYKLKINSIYYLESDKNYLIVHTKDNKFVITGSLKKTISFLDESSFIKCHQRFAVNLTHLESIDMEENMIYLLNKVAIPVSRRNKKALEAELLKKDIRFGK